VPLREEKFCLDSLEEQIFLTKEKPMASEAPNFYTLKPGTEYDDLFPNDLLDVLHQAFEKDKLESFTIKVSKPTARIKMRVIAIQCQSVKIRGP
jgi:hypothetical protein